MGLQPLFKRLYWISIILLIALCFIAFNPDNAILLPKGVAATNLQQILVLLGLVGLPGVLVWSSREVKKLKADTFKGDRLLRYRTIVYVRWAVFTGIGLYALLVQYLTQMKGALMFMMVVFVLFAFVWPTKARFETEMGDDAQTGETETETETAEEEIEIDTEAEAGEESPEETPTEH